MPPQQVPQHSLMTLANHQERMGLRSWSINYEHKCQKMLLIKSQKYCKDNKRDGLCMSMKLELGALNLELKV